MSAEQMALPFNLRSIKSQRKESANDDLTGSSFFDGSSTITVIGVSQANPNQVIVERDLDGKSWTAPAWMIRAIVGRKRKRRAA